MSDFKKDSELTLKEASSFRCLHAVEWKLKGFANAHDCSSDQDYIVVLGQLSALRENTKRLFDKYGKKA